MDSTSLNILKNIRALEQELIALKARVEILEAQVEPPPPVVTDAYLVKRKPGRPRKVVGA